MIFSEYHQLIGYVHVIHQRKVLLVDPWNLRASEARKKESIVLSSMSAGSQLPAKYPCPQQPPLKEPPAKVPPGLESRVNQILMMQNQIPEEVSEQEGPPRAVTHKEHRRQREQAGCPIPEGLGAKAASPTPPACKPMMFATVQEAATFVKEEQERVGESQRQAGAASSQGDKPAATSNAESGSTVSSAEIMSEPSAGDTEQLCEICTQEGAYACDTCLMAVCLRCGYTGRHDNTAICSYASMRRREVA